LVMYLRTTLSMSSTNTKYYLRRPPPTDPVTPNAESCYNCAKYLFTVALIILKYHYL
jgi:hypothetical protein